MKEKWTKDIQNRLKDFPKKAPEGLLNDIKSEMARRGLNTVSPLDANRKRTASAIMLRVASAAAIIAILFSLSHLFQREELSVTLPEVGSTMPRIEDESTPDPQEEATESLPPINSTTNRLVAKAIVKTDTLTENTVEEKRPEEEKVAEEEADTLTRQIPVPAKNTEPASSRKQWTYPLTPRKKHPSLDVGVYYSGLIAQMNPNHSWKNAFFVGLPNKGNGVENDSTATDSQGNSRAASRSFSRNKQAEKAKHHIPVRMGISLRHYLNERWYIQSGLTYSYLASDLSCTGTSPYETKQKLHYLGIPLQAGLRIWENERFKGYVSAGGQIERLVSGKATTHYTLDDGYSGTLIEDISDNRFLFSALASIGFEYALGKDISLYAEPGIHYYFKNGNGLQTHYNEQPLNFNISVGFRFHWKK